MAISKIVLNSINRRSTSEGEKTNFSGANGFLSTFVNGTNGAPYIIPFSGNTAFEDLVSAGIPAGELGSWYFGMAITQDDSARGILICKVNVFSFMANLRGNPSVECRKITTELLGGVNARLLRDLLSGALHDKHHTKTDKRIEDIYSTIHDACKHTGQAIQLINSEWMEILSNNTMFISDVGRISVSNRHKFVNGLSYSHRGCINTRQRFSRSLYGVQVTTLSREEVVA